MRRGAIFGLVGLFCFWSCSDSASVVVDIDLAVNGATNPITDLNNQYDTGQTLGIYFLVEEAGNCPPNGPFDFDTSNPVFEFPASGLGLRPASNSFNFDTSSLNPNRYYQIRMMALPTATPSVPSHEGKSDCPFVPGLGGQNVVTICFGNVAQTSPEGPLCADTLPFTACPSILAASQVCN